MTVKGERDLSSPSHHLVAGELAGVARLDLKRGVVDEEAALQLLAGPVE